MNRNREINRDNDDINNNKRRIIEKKVIKNT